MRIVLALLAVSVTLAVAAFALPLGKAPDGTWLRGPLLAVAVLVLAVSVLHGLVAGPATRSIALLVMAVVAIGTGSLLITSGGGVQGPSVGVGVVLLVLAAVEAVRAVAGRRNRRALVTET